MKDFRPTQFMGFTGITDIVPVIENRITVGFEIFHKVEKPVKISKNKTLLKETIQKDVVYIKEYDYDSKKPDGNIHGFGNPNYYLNVCSAEKKARAELARKKRINSNVNIDFINQSIK